MKTVACSPVMFAHFFPLAALFLFLTTTSVTLLFFFKPYVGYPSDTVLLKATFFEQQGGYFCAI